MKQQRTVPDATDTATATGTDAATDADTTTGADALHVTASRKAAFRLLPILCLVYFMAFVDRTNVGMAKTSLEADVGISAAAYGVGAGIFFLSYALLEVPSNLIMHRVGPRRWITRIAVTWGLLCSCMMFVQGELTFYLVRFLLGAAEAGLYPALMYVITIWFSQKQRVAMARMSGLMAAAGLAFINMTGLLGGFVGPYLYGVAESRGSESGGFAVLIGASVLGMVLVPLLRRTVRAEDRRSGHDAELRAAAGAEGGK